VSYSDVGTVKVCLSSERETIKVKVMISVNVSEANESSQLYDICFDRNDCQRCQITVKFGLGKTVEL